MLISDAVTVLLESDAITFAEASVMLTIGWTAMICPVTTPPGSRTIRIWRGFPMLTANGQDLTLSAGAGLKMPWLMVPSVNFMR